MKRKESMSEYAERRGNEQEKKVAKREAGMAPKNTTRKSGKMSKDAKDGGPSGWKKGDTKQPKGC